ncbi:MAG: hypothetical protein GQE15_14085 [Archangiaceae bacterium]|nr:hypothetical protein [Archangiaceae bacterium]
MSLSKCPSCVGVVPNQATTCPHCEIPLAPKSSLGKVALGLLGGLGASMTLMACYGAPASSCYQRVQLPDGGSTTDYVCDDERDASIAIPGDAGVRDGGATDGGASDAGVTDAGAGDGGP